jgi:hypothetical protein
MSEKSVKGFPNFSSGDKIVKEIENRKQERICAIVPVALFFREPRNQ